MTYPSDYGYGTGSQSSERSIWYYLIFPLDAWHPGSGGDGFKAQKAEEIWPIMIFMLPAIVLLAGFTLHLRFFSSLFFYGIEAFLLGIGCKFYGQLENFGLVIELAINFWISLIIQAFACMILFVLLSVFV